MSLDKGLLSPNYQRMDWPKTWSRRSWGNMATTIKSGLQGKNSVVVWATVHYKHRQTLAVTHRDASEWLEVTQCSICPFILFPTFKPTQDSCCSRRHASAASLPYAREVAAHQWVCTVAHLQQRKDKSRLSLWAIVPQGHAVNPQHQCCDSKHSHRCTNMHLDTLVRAHVHMHSARAYCIYAHASCAQGFRNPVHLRGTFNAAWSAG